MRKHIRFLMLSDLIKISTNLIPFLVQQGSLIHLCILYFKFSCCLIITNLKDYFNINAIALMYSSYLIIWMVSYFLKAKIIFCVLLYNYELSIFDMQLLWSQPPSSFVQLYIYLVKKISYKHHNTTWDCDMNPILVWIFSFSINK